MDSGELHRRFRGELLLQQGGGFSDLLDESPGILRLGNEGLDLGLLALALELAERVGGQQGCPGWSSHSSRPRSFAEVSKPPATEGPVNQPTFVALGR
jgi:hypothetical protein